LGFRAGGQDFLNFAEGDKAQRSETSRRGVLFTQRLFLPDFAGCGAAPSSRLGALQLGCPLAFCAASNGSAANVKRSVGTADRAAFRDTHRAADTKAAPTATAFASAIKVWRDLGLTFVHRVVAGG
jgi:hypothetical protein